jgi:hypothetical protein
MKKSILYIVLFGIVTGAAAQASLPTFWDMSNILTPPAGWSYDLSKVNGNTTYTGADYYKSAPQSIRIDGQGEYVQVNFSGRADTVLYHLRTNPGTDPGTVFNIDESVDGITWINVRSYVANLPQSITEHLVRLKPTSRYIRFILSVKKTGFNVALDDVQIKPAGPSNSPEIALFDGTTLLINNGNLRPGNSTLYPITIKNQGLQQALRIDSVRFSGPDAAYFKAGGVPDSISTKSEKNILLQMISAPAGSVKATMSIYSNDGVGNNLFKLNIYSISGSLATQPVAVPSLTFTSVRAWQIKASAGVVNAENVLVLVSKDSITETPVNGVAYEKGSYLGKARVVASGLPGEHRIDQIVANTQYYVKVFAWNGYDKYCNYNQNGYAIDKTTTPGLNAGSYYSALNPAASTFIQDLRNKVRPHFQIFYSNYGSTIVEDFLSYDTTANKRVLTCVYSGYKHIYAPPIIWDTLTREHSYPKSWMPYPIDVVTDSAFGTDLFSLFPTHQDKANAVRSNLPYNNLKEVTYQFLTGKMGKDSSGNLAYEPPDNAKGMVARACFYTCATYHTAAKPFTLPTSNQFINDLQDQVVLKRWHQKFPPTNYEIARQEYAAFKQNNRNPFIDNPGWACYIDFRNMGHVPSGDCSKFNAVKTTIRTIDMVAMPNPSTDVTIVDLSGFGQQQTEWNLMNISGATVLDGKTTDKTLQLNLAGLPAGAYLFYAKGSSAHGAVKVVKQ